MMVDALGQDPFCPSLIMQKGPTLDVGSEQRSSTFKLARASGEKVAGQGRNKV